MIHYHGTPITPITALESMAGQHFCVSYFRPDSLKRCLSIGQSLMLDNGKLWADARDVAEYLDECRARAKSEAA